MLLTNNSHLTKMTQEQKGSQDIKKVKEQVYLWNGYWSPAQPGS